MKQTIKCAVITVLVFLMHAVYAGDASINSPLGYWKTIDDVTGKPKSILKIEKSPNGVLIGQVIKIFPRPGYDQNEVCTACLGERHNQTIVGMVIMEGLKQTADDSSKWEGGSILDPLNGKTYRCYVEAMDKGEKLKVRGYIGVPLFGRSQTWLRVSGPQQGYS